MATAKQLAWRKKFAEMARNGKIGKSKKVAKRAAKKVTRTVSVERMENPLPILYKVQSRSGDGRSWTTILRTPYEKDAVTTAKELHKANPNRAYRVIDTER